MIQCMIPEAFKTTLNGKISVDCDGRLFARADFPYTLTRFPPEVIKDATDITVKDCLREDHGYSFNPGVYEGNGYKVRITPRYKHTPATPKNAVTFYMQDITGEFESFTIFFAFIDLLCGGQLLPVRPLCVKPSLTDLTYQLKSAWAVQNAAKVIALETDLAQLKHHVEHLGNIIQGRVVL